MWILNLSIKLPQWADGKPKKAWLSWHSQEVCEGMTSILQNVSIQFCTSLQWVPSSSKNRVRWSKLTSSRLLAAGNSQLRKVWTHSEEVLMDLEHAPWSWQTSRSAQLANTGIMKKQTTKQTTTPWTHIRWCKVLDKVTKTPHDWMICSTMASTFCFICTSQLGRENSQEHTCSTDSKEKSIRNMAGHSAHKVRINVETQLN